MSGITDPFINLGLEEHIFRGMDPPRPTLLMYVNDPCVVIGRNQVPWAEVNLPVLKALGVPLIRRRSGGGCVVHDHGNVNFSFLGPKDGFDRVKNCQTVVDAVNSLPRSLTKIVYGERRDDDLPDELRNAPAGGPLGADVGSFSQFDGVPVEATGPSVQLKVNHRHDIVTKDEGRKVSGSAARFTRDRGYHHGTMLLDSRLDTLRALLSRDPDRLGSVTGRGTASERSPVANINCDRDVFVDALAQRFRDEYDADEPTTLVGPADVPPEAIKIADELRQWDWRFGQTPLFQHTFTDPETDDTLTFHVDRGLITGVDGDPTLSALVGKRYLADELAQHVPSFVADALA